MANEFPIHGSDVKLDDLLALQLLASDLERVKSQRSRSRQLGEQRSTWRGQGREFAELKAYQSGDDVRRIDWHVTARKQAPFVKVMEDDRQSPQLIWVDLSSTLYFGSERCFKSVLACHIAAFLAWRLTARHHPVTAWVTAGQDAVPLAVNRSAQVPLFCQQLVQAHQRLAQGYLHHMPPPEPSRIATQLRQHPDVWLIGDLSHWRPAALQQAIPQRRTRSLMLLQPLDQLEQQLPAAGVLQVGLGQDKARLDTDDDAVRASHQQRFQHQQQRWLQWARERQAWFMPIISQEFHWSEARTWPQP